jgi:hypothetical protein
MKSIAEVLAGKKIEKRRSGVCYGWQDAALRWWGKLGIPGKAPGRWFKEFKNHRDEMENACGFAVDANPREMEKLVYWKLNRILKKL